MHPTLVGMDGDIDAMTLYAGLGVGSITSIEPAGEIVERFAAVVAKHAPVMLFKATSQETARSPPRHWPERLASAGGPTYHLTTPPLETAYRLAA